MPPLHLGPEDIAFLSGRIETAAPYPPDLELAVTGRIMAGSGYRGIILDPLEAIKGLDDSRLSSIARGLAESGERYGGAELSYAFFYLPLNLPLFYRPLFQAFSSGSLPTELRVLDAGCGPAAGTLALLDLVSFAREARPDLRFDLDVTLLDRAEGFLDLASFLVKTHASVLELPCRCRTLCLDLSEAEPGGRYDLVILGNVVAAWRETVRERAYWLVKYWRLLAPGGFLVVLDSPREALAEVLESSGLGDPEASIKDCAPPGPEPPTVTFLRTAGWTLPPWQTPGASYVLLGRR